MSASPLHRTLRGSLVVAVAMLFSVVFLAPASAQTSTYLRLAHFSPDAPAVDVYVASVSDPSNASIVLRGVEYGKVSDYQVVPSGTYIVSMRPAGAEESTPAVIATTLDAATGSAYTVAGVGAFDELDLTVLTDDLTLPPDGAGRARVIQAAASASDLDITLQEGQDLGSNVDFATTTSYSDVPAREWVLQVSADDETLLETPFIVGVGAVYSILILDTPSGLAVVTQVDALATGVVPAGGVETGGGAMARDVSAESGEWALPVAVMLPALFLVVLIGFGARRAVRARARAS